VREGRLFRVLNFETPDPECPVAVNTSNDTPAGRAFLTVNVTPQGQASALVARAFE
jgi:3-oxoacyl-[acyl-carrier-protein] synthase II